MEKANLEMAVREHVRFTVNFNEVGGLVKVVEFDNAIDPDLIMRGPVNQRVPLGYILTGEKPHICVYRREISQRIIGDVWYGGETVEAELGLSLVGVIYINDYDGLAGKLGFGKVDDMFFLDRYGTPDIMRPNVRTAIYSELWRRFGIVAAKLDSARLSKE